MDNLAVGQDGTRGVGGVELGHLDVRLCQGDGGTDVQLALVVRGKFGLGEMTPRVQADDLVGVEPAGVRVDGERRLGVGVIGDVGRVEGVECHGQGAVDRVRAGMRADGVSVGERGGTMGCDDGTAGRSVSSSPFERDRVE